MYSYSDEKLQYFLEYSVGERNQFIDSSLPVLVSSSAYLQPSSQASSQWKEQCSRSELHVPALGLKQEDDMNIIYYAKYRDVDASLVGAVSWAVRRGAMARVPQNGYRD